MPVKGDSILKKNIFSPGYSEEYLPTIKRFLGEPRVPTDKELYDFEWLEGDEITQKKNLNHLLSWTMGLQKRITKVTESGESALERGKEIRRLAGKYKRVATQMVRASIYAQGVPTESGETIPAEPNVRYQFPGVVDTDDVTLLVEAGERTVEEEAVLHGEVLANKMISQAMQGHPDMLEVVESMGYTIPKDR
jgi:hypothetical protein